MGNDEPESCSAERPKGTFCGEFRPTGNAPGTASVSWCEPNPERYFSAVPMERSFMSSSLGPRLRGDDTSHHAAGDLVGFDRFEQRAEIAFAESLIPLA